MSIIQVALDFVEEDRSFDHEFKAITDISHAPASQIAYNIEHNITPTSIVSNIKDIMEGARLTGKRSADKTKPINWQEISVSPELMTANELLAEISMLEKQMHQHAKDLEFEQAGALRDAIGVLREHLKTAS